MSNRLFCQMTNFALARHNMLESQIRTNKVRDERVLEAFASLPRELFVPEARRDIAYIDEDISLGEGRWLMEPMVLARMLDAAAVADDAMVLVLAGGSGYSTAILSRLCNTVVMVENRQKLAKMAETTLLELGINNAVLLENDPCEGCPAQAPFDIILIDGAVVDIPEPLTAQLAEGGRLLTVRQRHRGMGRAVVATRLHGGISQRELFDAATPLLPEFVPAPAFTF